VASYLGRPARWTRWRPPNGERRYPNLAGEFAPSGGLGRPVVDAGFFSATASGPEFCRYSKG